MKSRRKTKARERAEAIRRQRKLARKKMQREGLLPMPKPKEKAGPPARYLPLDRTGDDLEFPR